MEKGAHDKVEDLFLLGNYLVAPPKKGMTVFFESEQDAPAPVVHESGQVRKAKSPFFVFPMQPAEGKIGEEKGPDSLHHFPFPFAPFTIRGGRHRCLLNWIAFYPWFLTKARGLYSIADFGMEMKMVYLVSTVSLVFLVYRVYLVARCWVLVAGFRYCKMRISE
jgi:hypothetical protein